MMLIIAVEAAEPTIEVSIKTMITAASIGLTVLMLVLSLWKGLRKARLRPMFDVARVVVQIAAAVAVPVITAVVTPPMLTLGAVLVGVAIGVLQGLFVQVDVEDDNIFASRSVIGFLIWGAGLLLMQGAGLANRTGLVEIGQAVTWFSIGITVGLILGRHTNVDRAIKAVQAGAMASILVGATVILVAGSDVPVAEAQGCPPGYEQGYFDETIDAQRPTGDPQQCSIWVNGRQGTYSIYRTGCNLNEDWTKLSGQSPNNPIYGRNQGLGFVLYANMIVRVVTFPQSNDFDLEPAAAVYAEWFGPSCANAPAPAAPAPSNRGSTNQGSTGQGSSNQGSTGQGSTGQGSSNQGSTNQGGNQQGTGQQPVAPGTNQPPPAPPQVVTEQIDPNAVPATQQIEDEGGDLFPATPTESVTAVQQPTAVAEREPATTETETTQSQATENAGNNSEGTNSEGNDPATSEGGQGSGTDQAGTADGETGDGVGAMAEDAEQQGSESERQPDSEEVDEDEALATAVGGLVAAAAAGVITAAEAAAGIREALDRSGRSHVDENELLRDVADRSGIDLKLDDERANGDGDTADPANQDRGPDESKEGDEKKGSKRGEKLPDSGRADGPEPEIDQEWRRAREKGQALVDELESVRQQLDGATPAEKAQLMDRARQLAIDINADYSARSIMKPQGRTPLASFFDETLLAPIYKDVDGKTLDRLNELGLSRGGQPFKEGDMWDVRNESSAGTVGMDRDIALLEGKGTQAEYRAAMERAQARMNNADPSSSEYAAARDSLAQHRDAYQRSLESTRMSIDPDRLRAGAMAEMENLPAGSKRRAELQGLVDMADQLGGKRVPGGGSEVRLSPTDWNRIAQTVYDGEYERVTGRSSLESYQAVTTGANPEAYADTNALRSDRANNPLAPEHASQTASVGGVKDAHNQHLVDEGLLTRGEALQETARGTAKDMGTKVIPQLRLDPDVRPDRIAEMERIQDVMARAGRGEIPPSRIQAELAAATRDPNITMEQVLNRVEANFETSIARGNIDPTRPLTPTTGERLRAGVTSAADRIKNTSANDYLGAVGDAATVNQRMQENLANGMSGAEATAVAIGQTGAGNAAMSSGLADPRLIMSGGALLPRSMQGILPDQMVENTVGTGYGLGRSAAQSLADSLSEGTLDTTAIDEFATGLADNPSRVEPLVGVAVLSDFIGEEAARTNGSLISDVRRIYDTGTVGDMAEDFQQGVSSGNEGSLLQGIDHVSAIGSDLLVDPSTTMSDFMNDVATIAEHGVGDGYWSEAAQHTENVARDVPLVGTVITGWEELAEGIGESGPEGFATEMAEGASALGAEISDSLSQSMSNASDYVRSFF